MIASSRTLLTCPHCRAAAESSPILGTELTRCARCKFIFPERASAVEVGEDSVLDLLDESWTAKWGAIRADRYQVIRVLAAGAQGRLLLAHHRHLDQPCVIKLVSNDDEFWADVANQRLRNEAKAGVRVNHPNVARVFDCDCVDDAWYFVMEYISGHNLRHVIQKARRLGVDQVVDIGRQASAGLAAIHANELVHRDIKPSNLMLTGDGHVKIMDLGLVKVAGVDGDPHVTGLGQVVGTPLYMPPEQFESGFAVDARADIYSLGATLYHLLTGHPLFEGKDFKEIASKHRRAPVAWEDSDRDGVPEWLRDIIECCLAKRREHRIESAEALERALRNHESTRCQVSLTGDAHSAGVTVLAFRNLSRRESDEWIGDAIAEALSSRIAELDGAHVADRSALMTIIRQTTGASAEEPTRSQFADAARLSGVGHVITGSYQRQGDDIRIIAQAFTPNDTDARHLATLSGPVSSLFDLEDRLTERIVDALSPALKRSGLKEGPRARPTNLEAYKKYVLGRRAFADGDYHTATTYAGEAEELDPEYDEPISLIGACYARLGDYDRAVEYHQRHERRAAERNDMPNLAVALGNLGAMYYYKGDYAVAYDFLDRAAEISDRQPTPETPKLFANLGMVVMRLGKTEDAERAFERAIAICKQFNDLASMVWPYNGMGSVLLKQERYTEAREYHQRALSLAEEIGDRVMVGVSQMNIGRCACLMQDYSEAAIWFNAALGTLERTKFWNGLTLVYEHMAEMHLIQSRTHDALQCIDHRIELAARHGNKHMESDAWEQKARTYEQMKRTDDALSALKKSLAVSQRPEPYESLHRYLEDIATRKPFR